MPVCNVNAVLKRFCRLHGADWESDGGTGNCTPCPFHTTGRAVFRIRRLNPAEVMGVPLRSPME
jgi:hypothetical protein